MNKTPLILIIDDEQAILKVLKESLEDEAYQVETLSQGNKAIDMVGKLVPDLVLLDIFMPHCNGLELLQRILNEYPQQKVIIISGFGNIPIAIEAMKKGAIDFIEKPLNLDELLSKIAFLKEKKTLPLEPTQKSYEDEGLIGKSYTFLELVRQATQIAPLTYPIVIQGAAGSGKTTLARYIHRKSSVANEPFVTIDGEQTTDFLSFFAQPRGTFYLQHIDALSQQAQAALLALLKKHQNKQLRIIASTRNSLFSLLHKGTFNEGLFYLLNILPLELPDLSKHAYDIPLLVNHFLTLAHKEMNRQVIISTPALRRMRNYPWPGNIRQLKATVDALVSLSEDRHVITSEELVGYLGEKEIPLIAEQSFGLFNSLHEATEGFEKSYLLYLLKKTHYNLDQVSDRLNLSIPQLRNKLLELHIDTHQ